MTANAKDQAIKFQYQSSLSRLVDKIRLKFQKRVQSSYMQLHI